MLHKILHYIISYSYPISHCIPVMIFQCGHVHDLVLQVFIAPVTLQPIATVKIDSHNLDMQASNLVCDTESGLGNLDVDKCIDMRCSLLWRKRGRQIKFLWIQYVYTFIFFTVSRCERLRCLPLRPCKMKQSICNCHNLLFHPPLILHTLYHRYMCMGLSTRCQAIHSYLVRLLTYTHTHKHKVGPSTPIYTNTCSSLGPGEAGGEYEACWGYWREAWLAEEEIVDLRDEEPR